MAQRSTCHIFTLLYIHIHSMCVHIHTRNSNRITSRTPKWCDHCCFGSRDSELHLQDAYNCTQGFANASISFCSFISISNIRSDNWRTAHYQWRKEDKDTISFFEIQVIRNSERMKATVGLGNVNKVFVSSLMITHQFWRAWICIISPPVHSHANIWIQSSGLWNVS